MLGLFFLQIFIKSKVYVKLWYTPNSVIYIKYSTAFNFKI